MGFLNRQQEQDDELPGSGLRVDLEAKVCPQCRRTALPWQETCEDCDVRVVAPEHLPAAEFELPDTAFQDLADDVTADEAEREATTVDHATEVEATTDHAAEVEPAGGDADDA